MLIGLFTRLALVVIWLLHWLPLPVQAALGWLLGHVMYLLIAPRRRVVHTNLRLCFPELSVAEHNRLARQNAIAVTRSIIERGIIWWASEARVRRLVEFQGVDKVHALHAQGKAVIILVPHFVGLDMAGPRMGLEMDCVTMYSSQKNKVLEVFILRKRVRFGSQLLFSRQQGIRGVVKALKNGRPFFYLPDQDYGRKESIFVPFFGVQTATIPGLSRLAKLSNAVVLPMIIRMKPYGAGYLGEFGEPWSDFPSDDIVADTTRMNAYIEAEVSKSRDQYYWVHKRFKTRPQGEAKLY